MSASVPESGDARPGQALYLVREPRPRGPNVASKTSSYGFFQKGIIIIGYGDGVRSFGNLFAKAWFCQAIIRFGYGIHDFSLLLSSGYKAPPSTCTVRVCGVAMVSNSWWHPPGVQQGWGQLGAYSVPKATPTGRLRLRHKFAVVFSN